MAGKREAKREELKTRLIASARALIQENGLANLRARDIAAGADCALGSLYTVFADIDELILNVNSQTLEDMKNMLREQAEGRADSQSVFRRLALVYLSFALGNRNLWSALFEHRMPENTAVPEWHLDEHAFLIGLIAEPLAEAMPDASEEALYARARTFFAAIHGVIALSLENRFIGLPPAQLKEEVGALADLLANGLATFQLIGRA